MRRIVQQLSLSHFTVTSALGRGLDATLAALRTRRSPLRPCDFETADLPTYIGVVDGLESHPVEGILAAYDCRNNRLAQLALDQDGFRDAVAEASARYGAARIGVFAGTSTAGIFETEQAFRHLDPATGALPPDFPYRETHNTFSIADFVQHALDLEGPALSISAACASTAMAFATAVRMIACGLCDAAVVGGVDSLCLTTLYGFHALQLTAEEVCRPFDEARAGISIGEAGGFALLERDHGDSGIVLLGYGESSDAYHMSSPHPEGQGARRAMEKALAVAGLQPGDIDYVNLHGTATRVGDAAEDKAVSGLFGSTVPCSSTKGFTGHTLGAAGIVEAVISALALHHGHIPASPTTRKVDSAITCRYLTDGAERPLKRVMSNSFGFGGSNCSLILGHA
jgi:3-oxoacyl-[acyl-carrier-protein] synthase-1